MRLRTLLALLLAIAASPRARAADVNVITSVEVKDEGAAVVLSVKGSRKPSFTTFSMADPPRFVIDFSESRFQGVAGDIPVRDGVIQLVKNLSYGSDATAIARVMIAFEVEVSPPAVEDVGEMLVVRIAKPGVPAVAATERAAPEVAQPDPAQAEAAANARAEAERREREELAARAREEAQAQARAEAHARAEGDARAKADEAERLAAEDRAREEKARAEEDARARAQADAGRDREAQARAAGERQDAQERDAAEAQARADAKAEAERVARTDEERRRAEAQAAKPTEPEPAQEPAREPAADAYAAAAPATERLDAVAPAARLREVGFKQLPGGSRLFVRTSVTPRFTVQDAGENTIRIELENTRAERRNDLRFLDTSFFPSAVALVTPSRVGSSYVLEVKLKQRVPYQQKIEGDVLAFDFERPAQTASAAGVAPALDPAAQADAAPEGKLE
jgi:colicin import membrane protein